ncbi:vesicle transport protein USE1-like [Limulus polyphemus]|uniref:Vesicle transport protein USE1 n=1 Tax=Limulus polyphemus TaxID=6850 RepID=A0ABM1BUV3_LIMPO|nr:vesicle transport protein USE1-like [Limulus polyphemus]
MIPKSRLEINFCRLLSQCEELAGQRKQNDWRLEKYVKALEEKLMELKKLNTCQPSKESLAEYTKKVEFLKGVINADKLPSAVEKAMANQLLFSGLSSSPNYSRTKEIHLQNQSRYTQEMRKELFGSKDADTVPVDGSSDSIRQRKSPSDTSQTEDLDSVLRYHHSVQEKIASEMVTLAQSLKQNSLLAGHIIKKDTEVIEKSSKLADKNYGQLKIESDRLEKHAHRSCNWWLWLMIGLVCLTFLWMIMFIRLFPRRV